MFPEIVRLLVDTIGALIAGACLLRLWLQWQRVGMRNPVGELTMVLTDWIVKPLRRIVPGSGGIDWSSLIAAYIVSLLAVVFLIVATSAVVGVLRLPEIDILLELALVWLLKWALYLAFLVILIGAFLSWLNPFSPVLPVFDALAAPLLGPIRRAVARLFGRTGRFDFSPLVAVLIIQILIYILEGLSLRWLGIW